MHALSVKAPWPWAMFHAGKDVENRTWTLPRRFWNQLVLIHSGKVADDIEAWWFIREVSGLRPPEDLPLGALVGVARFTKDITTWIGDPSPWFIGTQAPGIHGWMIGRAMPLAEPIPCKGQRGFWKPTEVDGLLPHVCEACKCVTLALKRPFCVRCGGPVKRAVGQPLED
jgi:hypothetical protein